MSSLGALFRAKGKFMSGASSADEPSDEPAAREEKTPAQPSAQPVLKRRYSARRRSKNKTVISKLLALEAVDHKRSEARRWRLRSARDGIRVFTEEVQTTEPTWGQTAVILMGGGVVFALAWCFAVTLSMGAVSYVSGLRTDSPAVDIFTALAACAVGGGVVGTTVAATGVVFMARGVDAFAACAGEVWAKTGRVRADVFLRASPEDAFAFASADGALRDEWDRWYASSQTRTFDAHTALVDTIERAPMGLARALAPLPRVARTIRFWSRDGDGSFTIVAACAAGTEEHAAAPGTPYQRAGVKVEVIEDLFVIRPAAGGGCVAARVSDVESKLLMGLVPRTSRLGVAWAAARLREGMLGLRAACDQIIDDSAIRNDEKRCHFSFGANELRRSTMIVGDQEAWEEAPAASPVAARVIPGHPTPKNGPDGGMNRVFTQNASRRVVADVEHFDRAFGAGQPGCLKRFHEDDPKDPWGTYDEPMASGFLVRGPHYLSDRKKAPSAPSICELAGVEVLKDRGHPLLKLGERPGGVVSRLVQPGRLVLVINFVLPTPSHYVSLAAFYVVGAAGEAPSRQRQRLEDFVHTFTDAQRNDVLKIIPKLVEGPWVARHAVGQKPALLGHKITTEYHAGDGWFEIDIDVSTSSAATGALRILKSAAAGVVMDLAFTLEAQTEEDLPEQVLCTVSFQHFVLDVAKSPKIHDAE